MTHSADIKRIKEDLQKLNSESLTVPYEKRQNLLDQDIQIVVNTHWQMDGDTIGVKDKDWERLADIQIYGYTITQKELDILTEALKMVYMNHQDGEVKLHLTHNHEYINC
jgi:hypothetical protein